MGLLSAIRKRADERFSPETVNLWCHVVDGAVYMLGIGMVGSGELLPLLVVTRLGASNAVLGLVTSAVRLSFLAPLLLAHRMETVRRKKRMALVFGLAGRISLPLIAFVLLTLAGATPVFCLIVIAGLLLVQSAAMSATSPVWTDLLAETIPPHRTGRLLGYRQGFSAMIGLFAGPVCALILTALAFPLSYAVLYVVSFAIVMVSWLAFALVDEMPDDVVPRERQPAMHYFRDLVAAVRRDSNYRSLLSHRVLSSVGVAAFPFFAVVAAVNHGVNEAVLVGSLIVARRLATIIGTFGGPLLADRVGHKRVMQVGAVVVSLGVLVLALLPAGAWYAYLAVIFVRSIGATAKGVSQGAFTLRVYPRGRRVGYSTLSTVALALTGMVAAPAAGLIMDTLGYQVLFVACAAATGLALLPLRRCRVADA